MYFSSKHIKFAHLLYGHPFSSAKKKTHPIWIKIGDWGSTPRLLDSFYWSPFFRTLHISIVVVKRLKKKIAAGVGVHVVKLGRQQESNNNNKKQVLSFVIQYVDCMLDLYVYYVVKQCICSTIAYHFINQCML